MAKPSRYGPIAMEVLNSLLARNWENNGSLIRRYKFLSHTAACEFVGKTAKLADKMQHHPEVNIRYNLVTFLLHTNDVNGAVTKVDGRLADAIEQLYRDHSDHGIDTHEK